MIEMQWVKLAADYPAYEANKPRFEHATNIGGDAYVLQFREVNTAGERVFVTDWKDVEIVKEST